MKKAVLSLTAICSLCLLNGCGAGSNPPPPVVAATHFSVTTATATPVSGTPFNITVTALGVSGQTATTYSGTVHFTSSDSQSTLPADAPMTSVTGTFLATLNTAGPQTITVTDTASLKGTSSTISVTAGPSNHLSVVPATNLITAGIASSFTVTAIDATGNTVTNYSGTVHFTSSDGQAALPGDSTLTNGVGTFSVTLKTSGSQTITATDKVSSSINGTSSPISVSGPATHFSVTASGTASTRSSFTVIVTALDASNNVSTGYTGTVHITSTDGKAVLPANATLQNGGGFQVTLETAGTQTVTATDMATSSITGTSNSIAVTATATVAITSGPPPNGTVGSGYGQTKTVYEKCVLQFRFFSRTCIPCVPNTAACGGSYPNCAHTSITTPVCVASVIYAGFELTGTGGVKPYQWTASSLPPGLALKFVSPETLINGTPTPGTAATYTAIVTLNDSGIPPAPMTLTYPIIISNPAPPVVNTAPLLPGATVNQPFGYAFTASAGLPPYANWTETGMLPAGIAPLTTGGVLSGTPTITGAFPITVTVDDSLNQLSAAQNFNFQVYQHGFKDTGNMGAARTSHTATLLTDGTVLVAGGLGLGSAEKYDPSTGKFTPTTGSMSVARLGHTATLLTDGKVLITGGQTTFGATPYATAELFDPNTGKFMLTTGKMSVARTGHNATLLTDGTVLITGGGSLTADLFDPSTGMFTPTKGNMVTARVSDTATLLSNGKVLITGGFAGNAGTATAELFDPATGSFSTTGSMAVVHLSHTATLLNTGKVLIAGGNNNTSIAELYDPGIGSFSSTGTMGSTRSAHRATLLSDGTVVLAGGSDASGNILAAAELFDPASGTFTGTGGMQTPREVHTATFLKDGTVLVTGGVDTGPAFATAELYK